MNRFKTIALTLVVSLAGGLVAQMANLPAGMLMGGALAVSIVSVLGVPTAVDNRLRNTGFVIVGMTLGTNVAQDSLALVPQWPYSLIGLATVLLLIVVLCTLILTALGFDRGTAYLSSFPGHLSFALGMAESGYGDPRNIAVIQSVRILLLTILAPVVARLANASGLSSGGVAGDTMALLPLAMLALACVAGGFAFHLCKVPAGFVLGPMFVSTAGKLMGLYDGRMPTVLTLAGFVLMGALIGSRFSGTTLKGIGRAALGGVVNTVICIAVVSSAAFILTQLTDMPFGQIWLGLAPGALESMGALGVALGYDTAFIAAHHTARFFLLTLIVPTVGLIAKRKRPGE